jgi:hypothetical protein
VPTETGLRRRCAEDPSHKLYPRTDPVVIMLVESPDGNRALLGRGKKFTPGMYTCLSGFIDQCESVEEAVRREVYEEARVQVRRPRWCWCWCWWCSGGCSGRGGGAAVQQVVQRCSSCVAQRLACTSSPARPAPGPAPAPAPAGG